ncbi:antirestriction protein ArdA [Pantoea agglomerans]|uniref:antirestriction protein ArdA n=1 Tax=Enterobacter agglomerans TaxID=549 RepID=UPI003207D547
MHSSVYTPSALVTTYRKYNAGMSSGHTLNLTDFSDKDEFIARFRELNKDEAEPELMILDTEDIPGLMASESSISWTFIDAFRAAREERCEAALMAWYDAGNEGDFDAFQAAYVGEAENEEAYAIEYVEDHCLLEGMPAELRMYFDYEAYGRDLFLNGLTLSGGYVFRSL